MARSTQRYLPKIVRRYAAGTRAAAAAEFALILPVLTVCFLNVVEIGRYAYSRLELNNAGQAAVQAVWAACSSTGYVPATTNAQCSTTWRTVATTAAQSTSLGTAVTVAASNPLTPSDSEVYYCVQNNGATKIVAITGTKPTTGSNATDCATAPGDYIRITVSYTYSKIFTAITIIPNGAITRTAWMRLA
jgi:Flp pilus assembly protein TadG